MAGEPYDPEVHASAWVLPPTELCITDGSPHYWKRYGEDVTVIWWRRDA